MGHQLKYCWTRFSDLCSTDRFIDPSANRVMGPLRRQVRSYKEQLFRTGRVLIELAVTDQIVEVDPVELCMADLGSAPRQVAHGHEFRKGSTCQSWIKSTWWRQAVVLAVYRWLGDNEFAI